MGENCSWQLENELDNHQLLLENRVQNKGQKSGFYSDFEFLMHFYSARPQPGALPLGPRRGLPPRTPLSGAAAPEPLQVPAIPFTINLNKLKTSVHSTPSVVVRYLLRLHWSHKFVLLHLNHISDTKSPTQTWCFEAPLTLSPCPP